jgi:hypothetical protein
LITCAWIDTSSADTGSSQTISLGDRQRAGDADALALAARELVRDSAACGRAQAHRLEQLDDARPRRPRVGRELVDDQRLADDGATVMRGLSEA